jgi:LuxR family maltose regulon positive regulatory protein
MSIYERGLQLATTKDGHALRGAADMQVGMSDLYREHNELDTAAQHLLKSKQLGDLNGLPKNPYRWRVAMARIRQAEGDLAGALELLDEAERVYMGDFSPNVHPIAALKARVWVAQGRLNEAHAWTRQQGLSAEDDISFLREFEHITLARLRFAQYKIDRKDSSLREAIGLLERLRKAAQEGGRMGSMIEVLALQALANEMQGDVSAALVPLKKALTLAEPEGYVRIFLDEGEPMRLLILEFRSRVQDHKLLDYVDKLLAAFPQPEPKSNNPKSEILVEPLSQRELEVLRFFKTDLSGPEIARELVIGLSTVRTHTKSIYNKLNVNSRRAAVRRAEELGLI